jgi:hypothetical protein
MNTTTTIRRQIAACAIAAIVVPAFAACGEEIAPPTQDVGRNQVDKQDRQAPVPQRTTGNRFDFGDEYGTAKVPERKARPAGSGTRNRMDFGDDGR